jgi:predicted transport protein
MKLYTIDGNRLKSVDNHSFKLEKEIQTLVENNLDELFNLEFVKSELAIKNFRLDTLAYDQENKSFVIIEYKKERNFSVIDQGYTYMSILLNNKADFILEYHDHCGITLKREEVDWSQSKVIFVSPYFTEYQKNSINFKDVPFELWEIKRYANGLISLYNHQVDSQETIATISKDTENVVSEVSKEVKKYTEDNHLNWSKARDENIPELYQQLKERILNLGEVEILPRKEYISFRRKRPFADIVFYAHHLRIILNIKAGELDDPKQLTKDLSKKGHWGNGDYDIKITPDSDLDYVMFLVNQSFKKQEA